MSSGQIYDTREQARRAIRDIKDEALAVQGQRFPPGCPKAVRNPTGHGWIIVTDPPSG
jgi:hypothetical protein